MFRTGIADVGSVIPEAILDQWTVPLTGPGAPLVVSSPELAREVLNDRADHFTRDRLIRRIFRRSWGTGLAAAEGADWQRQRRAAAPFFTPKAVAYHLAAFVVAADAVLDRLSDGEAVDLGELAAQIVARIVLSVLVDGADQVDPDAAARDVSPYVRRLTGFTLKDLLPLPESLIDRLQGIDRDRAVLRLRAMAARLAGVRADKKQRADMIALIEGVGPIEDNIRGLFPAAMDTTVAGLGWALNTLALRPDWQQRLAAEGRAMGRMPRLEHLDETRHVVSEVLRLYPPAPLLARAAAHDGTLGGHPVRAGQTVIVAVYAMHRHRHLWQDPDTFDPDRFRSGAGNLDAFMPFGTGPRMCIAAHFAQLEMAVILARVLRRFRIESAGPGPEVSLQVTTCAIGGLRATLHRHHPAG